MIRHVPTGPWRADCARGWIGAMPLGMATSTTVVAVMLLQVVMIHADDGVVQYDMDQKDVPSMEMDDTQPQQQQPITRRWAKPRYQYDCGRTACEESSPTPKVSPPTPPTQVSLDTTNRGWWWWELVVVVTSATTITTSILRSMPHMGTSHAAQQQRARDEIKAQNLLAQIAAVVATTAPTTTITTNTPTTTRDEWDRRMQQVTAWQSEWLETVYGSGVTLADRQAFLERYGCTGWTEEVLATLIDIGGDRGFVEIGAGNGQWARILSDRYAELRQSSSRNNTSGSIRSQNKSFDYVMAYDNGSGWPLQPNVYHEKTLVARNYFYNRVQPLVGADSIAATLQQWTCRGRALLLIYPPPLSDMAITAVQAYDKVNATVRNTSNVMGTSCTGTIVYVGEGRGGANANDAFFDYFEDVANGWVLYKVVEVKSFGTMGYEKMYIFRKYA